MVEHDIGLVEVAFRLNVSPSTVARWMRGSNEPTTKAAKELAALFEVDWRSFYADDEVAA
jgi:transcriptional regulator with XRE-family HTH domain